VDYNTVYVHGINFIMAIIAIVILFIVLKRIKRDQFIVTMTVLSLVLMLNAAVYSGIYLVDMVDSKLFNVYFYNYYSLFIRSENCVSILWIAIMALRRTKRL
jgi:hypothetical protein